MGRVCKVVSYCNSKKRPALEAVALVAVFVVVRLSKTYAAYESFLERGVEVNDRKAERRWDRSVVLPEPGSPLVRVSGNPPGLRWCSHILTERQWPGFPFNLTGNFNGG